MFCMEKSVKASGPFGEVASPIRCRSWGCPNCQEWRQRCLQAQCINGRPNRFIVLTCRRSDESTPLEAARGLVLAWRAIVKAWRKQRKWHKGQFIAVFEPHESGWPHLHILWRGHWISQRWLSREMGARLNSPIVHVSMIRGAKSAAFYVAKYFSKAPTRFGSLKRYWTSGNYAKSHPTDAEPVFPKHLPKEVVNQTIHNIEHEWIRYKKPVWRRPPMIVGWGSLSPLPAVTLLKHRPRLRFRGGLLRWKHGKVWGAPGFPDQNGGERA